jgi:hypothetical protein
MDLKTRSAKSIMYANLKQRGLLKHLEVVERIGLKLILQKMDVKF